MRRSPSFSICLFPPPPCSLDFQKVDWFTPTTFDWDLGKNDDCYSGWNRVTSPPQTTASNTISFLIGFVDSFHSLLPPSLHFPTLNNPLLFPIPFKCYFCVPLYRQTYGWRTWCKDIIGYAVLHTQLRLVREITTREQSMMRGQRFFGATYETRCRYLSHRKMFLSPPPPSGIRCARCFSSLITEATPLKEDSFSSAIINDHLFV